jgi:GH25 family lysozyme M1 (1,4-beta-N-acetylmuramidase)
MMATRVLIAVTGVFVVGGLLGAVRASEVSAVAAPAVAVPAQAESALMGPPPGLTTSGLAAPAAAPGAAPSSYPISGIDVSAFQGAIDWAAVASGGAKFAYIRASEQQGIPDDFFTANYASAKANGLYAGAYHRARPDVSGGKEQADYFIDHSGFVEDGRTFPPMLDIEWPRTNWTGLDACYNMTPAQITGWIRDFVTEVSARTGKLAMIYTNPNWWNPCTGSDTTFGAYPLFNSGYVASAPPPPAGWATWTLWQYSDSGTLPGDQDVFNGDYAALAKLAGGTPFALYAHADGKYVTAESAGTASLIANRTAIGPWERFDQLDAGGGLIALRSHANGLYVSAGASPLIASKTVIGTTEKFAVVVNADASVSLRASNGRYVTAENAGKSALIANRTAIGPWERFDQVALPGRITLRAFANGRFVTAESKGTKPLIANRTAAGAWEQFDLVNAGGGYVGLRARINNRYVTAESAGTKPLIANRTAIGPWEKFRVVVHVDGSISLLALADGKYVCADSAGAKPLIANRVAAGAWETFRLL